MPGLVCTLSTACIIRIS